MLGTITRAQRWNESSLGWLNLLCGLWTALPFLSTFGSTSSYRMFGTIVVGWFHVSEGAFGLILALIGLWLLWGPFQFRRTFLLISAMLWAFMGILFAIANIAGIGWIMCGYFVTMGVWGFAYRQPDGWRADLKEALDGRTVAPRRVNRPAHRA